MNRRANTKWMIQPRCGFRDAASSMEVLLKATAGIYNLAFDCAGIFGGRHSSPRKRIVAGAVPKSTGRGTS